MFKFSFEDDETYDNGSNPLKVEMTFDSDITWPEAMDGFVQFLRGAGYFIPSLVRATLLDEDGRDLRKLTADELWDQWTEGEEGAAE